MSRQSGEILKLTFFGAPSSVHLDDEHDILKLKNFLTWQQPDQTHRRAMGCPPITS